MNGSSKHSLHVSTMPGLDDRKTWSYSKRHPASFTKTSSPTLKVSWLASSEGDHTRTEKHSCTLQYITQEATGLSPWVRICLLLHDRRRPRAFRESWCDTRNGKPANSKKLHLSKECFRMFWVNIVWLGERHRSAPALAPADQSGATRDFNGELYKRQNEEKIWENCPALELLAWHSTVEE